ncbi:MAG TPA: peptide MFS transporter [Allosphingosinicella sp.]
MSSIPTSCAPLPPEAAASGFRDQPRGLWFLAFTEAWERFSYYGMTALVVLYMVDQLLLPGHVELVVGFPAFRAAVESVTGPLSAQALASQTFGLYSGLVYFTPVFGGMIADRWLGARRTVVLGAILLSAGHLAMAFDASFLIALLLLVLGTGCLKGNISAQVGTLYDLSDVAGRTRGFTIFSMGINVGATVGPLACGALAQAYGWHVGFGAAALLMWIGLVTYLVGLRHLPPDPPRRGHVDRRSLDGAEKRTVILLVGVICLGIFQTMAYYQCFNVGLVWIQGHVDVHTPLGTVPTPWFNSIDAFVSIIAVPPVIALWRRQAAKGREPTDVSKIGIGAAMAAASSLLLVLGSWLSGGQPVSALWPLAAFAGMGLAFLYYWPPILALISRTAPAPVNGTMMGVAFLNLFVGNVLMGYVGTFYEQLGPTQFWLLNTAIALTGALFVLIVGRPLTRALG